MRVGLSIILGLMAVTALAVQPLKVFRTAGRRFAVVGGDSLAMARAGRWAERMTDAFEQRLGVRLPHGDREVRIVLWHGSNSLEASEGAAPVIADAVVQGRRVQRLVITDAACLDAPETADAWCRLLLAAAVDAAHPPRAGSAWGLSRAPAWLAAGLSVTLDAVQRGAAVEATLARWEAGQLPPVAGWLAAATTRAAPFNAEDRALYGAFWAWFFDTRGRAKRVDALLDTLGRQGTVSVAWLAERLAGGSLADLDTQWDRWLLEKKRVVFRPGATTSRALDQLRAGLLLYPGDSGIPLGTKIVPGSDFAVLTRFRDAPWLKGFCHSRKAALQLMTAGRDEAFRDVVSRYVAFLDALERRERPARLRTLLRAADAARKAMTEEMQRHDDAEE